MNVFLQFHGEFFKSNKNFKFYKPIFAHVKFSRDNAQNISSAME